MNDEIEVEETLLELNQLRDRSERLPEIYDETWEKLDVNKQNKELIAEFLDEGCRNLAPKTIKQYRSALRIFAKFIMDEGRNKPFYKVTKRTFLKYQNWLLDHGQSSSAIRLKRSAISSLLKYCENILSEEDENWENFKNFIAKVDPPTKTKTYDKIPINEEEFSNIKSYLLKNKKFRDYAIVVTLMRTGMRIGELRQLTIIEADKRVPKGKKFVKTELVRGKGRGIDGKPISYIMTKEVINAIKLWMSNRKDKENEYLFVIEDRNGVRQISENYFSTVCTRTLTPLCERRINPHLFRGSAATHFLEQGIDITVVKELLNHSSVATTSDFYDLRSSDDLIEEAFKNLV